MDTYNKCVLFDDKVMLPAAVALWAI